MEFNKEGRISMKNFYPIKYDGRRPGNEAGATRNASDNYS